MRVPDDEDLFRFMRHSEYEEKPGEGGRVSTGLFRTRGYTVSVNRGSIWPLQKNLEVAPPGWGLCSLTAGELRAVVIEGIPIAIEPAPIDPPEVDRLLNIPNPSHANVSRELTKGEAKRAADAASKNIHRRPEEAAQ